MDNALSDLLREAKRNLPAIETGWFPLTPSAGTEVMVAIVGDGGRFAYGSIHFIPPVEVRCTFFVVSGQNIGLPSEPTLGYSCQIDSHHR